MPKTLEDLPLADIVFNDPDALQIESLLIEFRGSLDVRDDQRDMTKFCHGVLLLGC